MRPFLLLVSILILLFGACNQRPVAAFVLPDDLSDWKETFKAEVAESLSNITEEEVDQAYEKYLLGYKSRLKYRNVTDDEPYEMVTPEDFRAFCLRYIEDDFEPFVATSLGLVPPHLLEDVCLRIQTQTSPKLVIDFKEGLEGSISFKGNELMLNPVLMGASYEHVRHTLSHEMVHYLIQGDRSAHRQSQRFIREGLTEYITVHSFEVLGWYESHSYQEDVMGVSLLFIACGQELMEWFLAPYPDDEKFLGTVKDRLVEVGIDDQSAQEILRNWTLRDEAYDRLHYLPVEVKIKEVEIGMRLKLLGLKANEYKLAESQLQDRDVEEIRRVSEEKDALEKQVKELRQEFLDWKESFQERSDEVQRNVLPQERDILRIFSEAGIDVLAELKRTHCPVVIQEYVGARLEDL